MENVLSDIKEAVKPSEPATPPAPRVVKEIKISVLDNSTINFTAEPDELGLYEVEGLLNFALRQLDESYARLQRTGAYAIGPYIGEVLRRLPQPAADTTNLGTSPTPTAN